MSTKILSRERWDAARTYLFTHGRPLERSLFAYHFEEGTPEVVVAELSCFQNTDGGFGCAIEPDLRAPSSSAIATSVGLQVLREIGAPEDGLLVKNAFQYLLDTYDGEHRYWPITTPAVNEAPHAPWWHYSDDLPQRWRERLANPRAELIGYFFDYPEAAPESFRNGLLSDAIAHLDEMPEAIEMHDLLCYARLFETKGLPDAARAAMGPRLRRAAEHAVATDPGQWIGYGLRPLTLAPAPESPFAADFAEAIEHNLDFAIEEQGDDGAWHPNWSWPDDAWAQAERDWAGVLTLRTLTSLRAYGRCA